MARLMVEIPDELDKKFRIKVIEIYGSKRGVLGKAVAEALELWLKTKQKQEK